MLEKIGLAWEYSWDCRTSGWDGRWRYVPALLRALILFPVVLAVLWRES